MSYQAAKASFAEEIAGIKEAALENRAGDCF